MDELEHLVTEAAIRRVVAQYCRGIDRLDLELVRACYHADAVDVHGSFSGTVDEYLAWVGRLLEKYDATAHYVANQLVEIADDDPDRARVETYGVAVHRAASGGPHLNLTTGFRFVDRFERRGGEWRIAHRVAVTDWSRRVAPDDWWPLPEQHRRGERGPGDALHDR